eukprot:m.75259 g.75259  ORF g.75259 m.75259 type:complete len:130 (+) comp50382_c0_seq3:897-1286(+)
MLADRLQAASQPLLAHFDRRQYAVERFLLSMDTALLKSRQVREALDAQALHEDEWQTIIAKAQAREQDSQTDCSICLCPLDAVLRPCCVLRCAHLFHQACLDSFKRFSCDELLTCPFCRSPHFSSHSYP